MTDLDTILSWFQTGDMPTQEEFKETFSSFRHNNTKIPIAEVEGLESSLNNKISVEDYVKDGKIRADKIEDLGLTDLIESSEKDISEFAENSDKYEFQKNDFIAVPDADGNFSLYLFKGGEKRDKINYLPMSAITNSTDTLETVMNRSNIAPKEIQFHDNGKLSYNIPLESYLFTSGKSETATGKYNTGIGNKVFSKLTSGFENTSMGGKSSEELTTGYYNVSFGSFTLSKTTTGAGNTGIGYASFYSTTTGSGNTGLGLNSGQNNVTGNLNTYIGHRAGFSSNGNNNVFVGGGSGANHGATTGSKNFGNNTFLGYYSGYTSHAMGTWGDNNVVIGSYAPLGGGVNNQLVIDSYTSAKRHDSVSPLIGGDFAARTLSFDASLQIRRLQNAEGDATYTRQLVQKDDGTIGYESKGQASVRRPAYKRIAYDTNGLLDFKDADLVHFTFSYTGEPMYLKNSGFNTDSNNGNYNVSTEDSNVNLVIDEIRNVIIYYKNGNLDDFGDLYGNTSGVLLGGRRNYRVTYWNETDRLVFIEI